METGAENTTTTTLDRVRAQLESLVVRHAGRSLSSCEEQGAGASDEPRPDSSLWRVRAPGLWRRVVAITTSPGRLPLAPPVAEVDPVLIGLFSSDRRAHASAARRAQRAVAAGAIASLSASRGYRSKGYNNKPAGSFARYLDQLREARRRRLLLEATLWSLAAVSAVAAVVVWSLL